jgi:hypothetical protein
MAEGHQQDATPKNLQEFLLTAYQQCFAEKHHYDNLSWTIGAILLVFVGAILAYIPQIKPALKPNETFGITDLLRGLPGSLVSSPYLSMVVPRLILGVFALLLLKLWHRIYERNRIWAEVANQKIRDFERVYHTEGIGIRFLKDNGRIQMCRSIVLRNTDETGKLVQGYANSDVLEPAQAKPMHQTIPTFLRSLRVLLMLACLLP